MDRATELANIVERVCQTDVSSEEVERCVCLIETLESNQAAETVLMRAITKLSDTQRKRLEDVRDRGRDRGRDRDEK
jgi:hypothetical protein